MAMTQTLVIGVDVGGTNTSAVCLHGTEVVSYDRVPSVEDVTSGIKMAIHNALQKIPRAEEWSVTRLTIGITHFINSLAQRSQLVPVSVVRLCGPATRTLGPFDGFPDDLRELIGLKCFFVNGGYQVDGSVITEVDEKEITEVIKEIKESNIRNVVISGVFSSKNKNQEMQVGRLFAERFPEASVTLSSDIPSNGLLDRENAAILNETLKPLCQTTVNALTQVVNELCLGCPLFFTQNDGNLLSSSDALKLPVKIISSGPSNSMLGASHLSGVKDAVVVDIGGASTTVGSLQGGCPRLSSLEVCLGGVDTNLRMPDVLSIGLGGGSVVTYEEEDGAVKVDVGPNSVGKLFREKALIFGGSVTTVSDIAAAYLKADLGDGSKVRLSPTVLEEANRVIQNMLKDVVEQMKTGRHAIPVILVGGGSILKDMSRSMKGITEFIIPAYHQIAGAVGAALCQSLTSNEGLDQPKTLHQMIGKTEEGSSHIGATATPIRMHLRGDGTNKYGTIQHEDSKFCKPVLPTSSRIPCHRDSLVKVAAMQKLMIGVDVGHTNTNVALFHGEKVVADDTVHTTEDVTSGIRTAIQSILEKLPKDKEWSVSGLNIGTNYFLNSLVQRSQLVPVSVVRLCGPATRALGPFDDFPEDLCNVICSKCFYVDGGYQVDGSVITNVDENEIIHVIKEIQKSDIRNVVICGVFSYVKTDQEKQVGQLFARYFPEASITLSSEIGFNGLLERENAAILNESLKPFCHVTVSDLTHLLEELCLRCPLVFIRNDGSIMSSSEALLFPVRTFSCASSSSIHGVHHLSVSRQWNAGSTIEPTVPFVDKTTGEWILSEYDVHCISIGTGILGSGGGGAPKIGLLRTLKTLKKGGKIRVIHPKRMETNCFKEGKVGVAAFMGAPTVGIEKIPNGREIKEAIESIDMILKTNFSDENSKQRLAVMEDDNIKYITDFDPNSLEVTETDERGVVALMCPEIGGSNAMVTLCAGADMGLPVIDCDGMGRAFPELQMYSPSIYGHPMYPSALVDEKGQREVVLWVKATKKMEDHLRKVLGRMGSCAAIAVGPLSGKAVLETCIMFSLTRAYKLGDAVLRAQRENRDPVESICEHADGVHLITGKISQVFHEASGGFDRGTTEIAGTGKFADQEMIIDFQNENLIAKRRQAGDEKVVVTTPDIITVVEIETGKAITNDEIKNGMHVAIIALASPPQLRTEAALKVVGPRVFGHDVDFTPIGEYHSLDAVPLPP